MRASRRPMRLFPMPTESIPTRISQSRYQRGIACSRENGPYPVLNMAVRDYPDAYTAFRVDKVVRDLFKELRARRALTQPAVAKAGGVAQGLISRIESDAEYQPSASVFMRAVLG